ncbi:MBL fold metallo-hydrolase [Ramlibacter humi]|uniref:MBL fold metallo-hydrolase n=1 Tax=Ramlibacter humi TaxID=2530451 RepID=UPI003F6AA9A6
MPFRRARALLLALLAAPAFAVTPVSPEGPAMLPQQVSASAWFVQGQSALGSPANRNFISNAGFVVTPAGVVVIDALGSPSLAQQLLQRIRRVTPQPVKYVVLTHYHADHVYGLQAFRAAGAKIVAHRAAREYLNSDTARLRLEASRQDLAPWIDANTHLVEPDEWLDGPRDLQLGGTTLKLLPVGPSHTPEDLVVYLPSEKVLFAGDIVFRNRIPFVGQADSRRWIRALDQVLALDADVIVPGHGPASHEAKADAALTRDYLLYLRQVMGTAAKNLEPWEDAYKAADWSRFDKLPLFQAANRMNAYNTYLLMEQEKD